MMHFILDPRWMNYVKMIWNERQLPVELNIVFLFLTENNQYIQREQRVRRRLKARANITIKECLFLIFYHICPFMFAVWVPRKLKDKVSMAWIIYVH